MMSTFAAARQPRFPAPVVSRARGRSPARRALGRGGWRGDGAPRIKTINDATARGAPCRRPAESASRRLVGRLRATEDREVWAGEEDEEERDEDGLYIGTYSTFFTDPAQIKGVAAFCLVLTCFFGGGQVLSGLLLPYLFGGGRGLHTDLLSWDYWTKF
mmetsp:Transcript_34551/g.89733  ORF Transcript_34551/g.89733 Transcript_34551/m.89733 type:complete len:159 (+) Transcript_34551:80-556(+)